MNTSKLNRDMTTIRITWNSNPHVEHEQWNSFVCMSAYANVYFKTTIMKQNIKIILIARVPSSQALPGSLITAPPSVCVPELIGVLAVWISNQKKILVVWIRESGSNSYQEKARIRRHLVTTIEEKHLSRLRLILKGAASRRHNLHQQKKQPNWVQEKERGESIPSRRLSGGEVRACVSSLPVKNKKKWNIHKLKTKY